MNQQINLPFTEISFRSETYLSQYINNKKSPTIAIAMLTALPSKQGSKQYTNRLQIIPPYQSKSSLSQYFEDLDVLF